MVSIKDIVIDSSIVIYRSLVAIKEGKVNWETRSAVEADERVDVDGKWSSIIAQELDNLQHDIVDVCPEVTFRRHI